MVAAFLLDDPSTVLIFCFRGTVVSQRNIISWIPFKVRLFLDEVMILSLEG